MTNASNWIIDGCGSCRRLLMIFISPQSARTRAAVVCLISPFQIGSGYLALTSLFWRCTSLTATLPHASIPPPTAAFLPNLTSCPAS